MPDSALGAMDVERTSNEHETSNASMRRSSQTQRIGRVRATDILTKAYLQQEYLVNSRTVAEISAASGVSQRNVSAYLHKYGVVRREHLASLLTEAFLRREYVECGRTTEAISAEIGVSRQTVCNYMRRYGIPLRPRDYHKRKYSTIDSTSFAELTTDWHAYWIGFLAADGYIRADDREQSVQIRLKASDAHHLDALKEGLCAEAPVQYLTNEGYPAAQLILRDRVLVEALARWGVTANKSLTLSWPDRLPDMLVPAYIRGCFDGDGTVYQRHRSSATSTWQETVCRFISGSGSFLDRLADELTQRGIRVLKIYRNPNSNTYILSLSSARPNLLAFASLIYEGGTISLARKRAVFESL